MAAPERGRSGPAPQLLLLLSALLFLLALIPRVYRLAGPGLWTDEAATWLLTRGSVGDLFGYLSHDVHPPLYYLVVMGWTRLAGEGEGSLRLVSALSGALTVLVLPWAGSRVLGGGARARTAGVWAGLLLAVSPLHLHYSQEAKSYALLLLLEVLAAGAFACARDGGRSRSTWALIYLLLAAGAALVHATALFFLAGVALLPLLERGSLQRRALGVGWALLPGVVLVPWVARAAWSARHLATALNWMERHFQQFLPWQLPLSLAVLSPGTAPPLRNLQQVWSPFQGLDASRSMAPTSSWVWLGVGVVLALAGTALVRRPGRALRPLLLATGPLVLLWAASFLRPVYLLGRTDVMALPWLLTLCGFGLALVPGGSLRLRRGFSGAAALLWLVLAVPGVAFHYRVDARSGAREVFRTMAGGAVAGDRLVITGERYATALYYLDREGAALGVLPFPAELADHPAWEPAAYDEGALRREARDLARSLDTGRIYLLDRGSRGERILREEMESRHGSGRSVPGTPLGTLWIYRPGSEGPSRP